MRWSVLHRTVTLILSCALLQPHNDIILNTVAESPVLQREGFTQNGFEKSGDPVPTVESGSSPLLPLSLTICSLRLAWTFAKQKWQRTDGAREDDPSFRSAQILPGFCEQVYA